MIDEAHQELQQQIDGNLKQIRLLRQCLLDREIVIKQLGTDLLGLLRRIHDLETKQLTNLELEQHE